MFIRNILGAFKLLAVLTFITLLASCGGGGGGDDTKDGGDSSGQNSTLASVSAMAATEDCPNGGITVEGGIDSNGNNVLDPGEVTSTQYVCNGADGSDGISSLVAIVDEAAGENCSAGGKRINVGQDLNNNGILEESEVVSHDYVCSGADGTNGHDSLIRMEQISSGEDCALGGTRVTSGLDENNNGVLDQSEITYTTYICNGAAGPGITWETKYASFTAQKNKGYLVDSAALVTAILPLSAALSPGDIIAIDGVGSGGWTIAQNAEQRIITRNITGSNEYSTPRGFVGNWTSVASSDDGTKLVAVGSAGYIYTSTDSGVTWTARDRYRQWTCVASSADGTRLIAGAGESSGGQLYISIDSGVTWTACEFNGSWRSVTSSADGTRLAAVDYDGQIYTSIDSGVSWTAHESNRFWISVASSADGTKLVAAVNGGGYIYTSTNSGESWSARGLSEDWMAVASSADGAKLVAVAYEGQIYTSANSGESWTPRELNRNWYSVASSADGTTLVAIERCGQIYISTDSGLSWTARDTSRYWYDVACSSDGKRLVMVTDGIDQRIYTLDLYPPQSTTPGAEGFISGSQYDYIELQYIGNDTFNVLDYIGYDLVVH